MRQPLLFFLVILLSNSFLNAQRIQNVRASSTGEKIIILFDITDASEGQKFKVRLFGSHDNYAKALNFVSGDAGESNELLPGSKKIEWEPRAELNDFDGDITFEVRADVVAAPVKTDVTTTKAEVVRITGPLIGAKHKRGKSLDIQWQGVAPSQLVKLELWKGGVMVSPIGEMSYRSNFPWSIPKGTKAGRDYQIKLTTNTASAVSDHFSIKPKVPFLLKVLPVVAIGGAVYVLTSGGGNSGGGPGGGDNNSLPQPPALPE